MKPSKMRLPEHVAYLLEWEETVMYEVTWNTLYISGRITKYILNRYGDELGFIHLVQECQLEGYWLPDTGN
jgi:hypothetical protein